MPLSTIFKLFLTVSLKCTVDKWCDYIILNKETSPSLIGKAKLEQSLWNMIALMYKV